MQVNSKGKERGSDAAGGKVTSLSCRRADLELVGRKRPGWGVGVELVFWWQSQVISLGDFFFIPADVYEGRVSIFPDTE